MQRASSHYSDGEIFGFETIAKCITRSLAYIVEVERIKAKIGGRNDFSEMTLRTTSILRPEAGTWKVVHRHADAITTVRAPETIIQK
jgi:hypothetical protein